MTAKRPDLGTDTVTVRQAREADHPGIVAVVDEWWGRRVHQQLPRLWLRHFSGTSVVAQDDRGRVVGFAVGFVSPDRAQEAILHLVGVAPGRRRQGTGRALFEAFASVARDRGATVVSATTPPGEPIALGFLRGLGFSVETGAGTTPLYGTPSYTNRNREGDDQVMLTRPL